MSTSRAAAPRRLAGGSVLAALLLTACAGTDAPETSASAGSASSATSTASTTTSSAPPPLPPSTTAVPPTAAAGPATWQPVEVAAATPPPRSGAVLVAAADGTLWLHGGQVDREPLGDLWRFDGRGWEQVVTEGGPAPRSEHVAVWDADRDRLVLGLGEGQPTDVFDDVWAFDPAAGAWTQIATGGPAARYGACDVLDDRGRMVVTHGFSAEVRFDDTWAFDLATDTWTDVSPADGPRPSARCLHACGYDSATGELHLFGGRNDAVQYLGDTWTLGAAGWTEVPGAGPSARVRSRGAHTDGFVVFGGVGADGFPGDSWTLTDGTWTSAGTVPGSAGRQAPAVAEADGVVWAFGGLDDAGPSAELWRLG